MTTNTPRPAPGTDVRTDGRKPVANSPGVTPAGRFGGGTTTFQPSSRTADGKFTVLVRRRVRRRPDSRARQALQWFVRNQINLSLCLFVPLALCHYLFPDSRVYTSRFFSLAYYNSRTGRYGIGQDDAYFVLGCVVFFMGLRTAAIEYIFTPFAKDRLSPKALARFGEQGWLAIYYALSWTTGLYLYCRSPYYLNLRELWTDWPSREMDGLMKAYCLVQLSCWCHQIIIINIEERRKDHWQMFTHHVVTIGLIVCSYRYGHTRVANLILILMDIGDLIFGIAKCLKYTGYNTACDVAFGLFMTSWFVARHIFYPMVCYSIWAHTPDIMPTGCFKASATGDIAGPFDPPQSGLSYLWAPFLDSEAMVCYNEAVKWAFLAPLLFLQLLCLVWFGMIVRVAVRVLKGNGADDVRSDDEEGEENEDEEEIEECVYEEAQAIEEEVGVEGLDLKGWEKRSHVKTRATIATGVTLPGHSDRKELLGRIGCEKQVN